VTNFKPTVKKLTGKNPGARFTGPIVFENAHFFYKCNRFVCSFFCAN